MTLWNRFYPEPLGTNEADKLFQWVKNQCPSSRRNKDSPNWPPASHCHPRETSTIAPSERDQTRIALGFISEFLCRGLWELSGESSVLGEVERREFLVNVVVPQAWSCKRALPTAARHQHHEDHKCGSLGVMLGKTAGGSSRRDVGNRMESEGPGTPCSGVRVQPPPGATLCCSVLPSKRSVTGCGLTGWHV